jgi:hypothetical protein
MKLLNWIRFTWDLKNLPSGEVLLPDHYHIAPAEPADEMGVRKVFSSSFLLDSTWNPAIGEVMQTIQLQLDKVFTSDSRTCLALRHGTRVIGAVVLSSQTGAGDHLMPGPSLLIEYRNRGFGTCLLERSLQWLREAGLSGASAIAPAYAPAAKFLYPKFSGVAAPVESSALLAA